MGNPQDIDRVAPAAVDSASPGQRLRLAREARQLTRDAVAVQMRIEAKVIDALERDDYSQLPAAVFVRGYLRAYAKLVGLAAEPLVEAFDQRTMHVPPPLVLPTAIGPDIASRSGYARWIVFALALLSLLLFIGAFGPRVLFLILLATVMFGYALKPLGLVLAIVILIVVSAAGGHDFRNKEIVILTTVLVLFSVYAFVKGLGLPFNIWPGE